MRSGKFDGVLLVSDFDNTLVYTQRTFEEGAAVPQLSPYNHRRIRYFMENGGRFAVATGRTWQLIRPYLPEIPTNAPCGVGNGAGLVDIPTGRYLYRNFLPDEVAGHMEEVLRAFPDLSCEIFRGDDCSDAINPCDFTYYHAQSAGYAFRTVKSVAECPLPIVKILFEGTERQGVTAIAEFIRSRPWAGRCELIFSSDILLELTARNATKGVLVEHLAAYCGVDREHLYCIGDQKNDLSMLEAAKEGFAPSNAVEAVKNSGVTVVGHCEEGAVGQVIDLLDQRY